MTALQVELGKISFTLHIELLHIVPTLCYQLLLDFSGYPFNSLQLAFSHIADVHEDFS